MATTDHRGYQLPDETRDIDEEFFLFQLVVLPAIDLDMHSLFEAVAGKADEDHGHTIAQIEGLVTALEGKMPAGTTFTLASLADVAGMADAPDGYIPVKVGDRVVFQAALSALGEHSQAMSTITGLGVALAEKKDKASEWFGTQAAYDLIVTKDPNVTYNIFAA